MFKEVQIQAETRIVEALSDRVVVFVRISDTQEATVTMFVPQDETISSDYKEFEYTWGEETNQDEATSNLFEWLNPGHSNEEWSNPEWRSLLIVESVPVSRRITLRPQSRFGRCHLKITCIEITDGRVLHDDW